MNFKHLYTFIEDPRHAHVPVHHPDQPQIHKYKSPAKKEKNIARAAAHQAKLQKTGSSDALVTEPTLPKSSTSYTASIQTHPSQHIQLFQLLPFQSK